MSRESKFAPLGDEEKTAKYVKPNNRKATAIDIFEHTGNTISECQNPVDNKTSLIVSIGPTRYGSTNDAADKVNRNVRDRIDYFLKCGPCNSVSFEKVECQATKGAYNMQLLRKAKRCKVKFNYSYLLRNPDKLTDKQVAYLEIAIKNVVAGIRDRENKNNTVK